MTEKQFLNKFNKVFKDYFPNGIINDKNKFISMVANNFNMSPRKRYDYFVSWYNGSGYVLDWYISVTTKNGIVKWFDISLVWATDWESITFS